MDVNPGPLKLSTCESLVVCSSTPLIGLEHGCIQNEHIHNYFDVVDIITNIVSLSPPISLAWKISMDLAMLTSLVYHFLPFVFLPTGPHCDGVTNFEISSISSLCIHFFTFLCTVAYF
jgi:hypothetical protein